MDLILLSSIALRVLALTWSLRLFARLRDLRILLLASMLALMATRQSLTLARRVGTASDISWDWTEMPGLLVSVLALVFVLKLSGLIRDNNRVTDRLAASQSRLLEAQRVAKIGSWELDLRTNTLWWSPEVYEMFELEPEEFGASYEAFLERVHPDDRGAVDAAYRHSVDSRTPYEIKHRLQMADGSIKHVRERSETYYDEAGTPVRSVGTVQDITYLEQAEDTLRRQEAHVRDQLAELDHIYRTAPVGLCLMDTDLRFIRINQRMADINGKPIEEHIGRSLSEVIPEIAPSIAPVYQRVLDTGEPAMGFEVQGPSSTNRDVPRTWLVSYFPQEGLDGTVIGVSTVVQEITERVKLEREVLSVTERERRRLGSDLHDGVGQLVVGAQYLAATVDRTLKRDGIAPPAEVDPLRKHLAEILAELRSLARGLNPVNLEDGGLPRALDGLTRRFAQTYDIGLEVDVDSSTELDDPDRANHLFRIAQEALTNVARHSAASRVEVSLKRSGQTVTLRVADDGIGVPGVVGAVPRDHAAGMGLRTMRYRADLINGDLKIVSSPEGTEVRCTFGLGSSSDARLDIPA